MDIVDSKGFFYFDIPPTNGYNAAVTMENRNQMRPNQINKLRLDMGMSRQELADVMGVSRMTIYRWEDGSRQISKLHSAILHMIQDGEIQCQRLQTYINADSSTGGTHMPL